MLFVHKQEGNFVDHLTAFGIRIWTPERSTWVEVGVGGTIVEARLKSLAKQTKPISGASNRLTNGR